MDSVLHLIIQALITRTWIALYTTFNRSKKQIDILESEAIAAFAGLLVLPVLSFFSELDQDKLTMTKVKAVILKVIKWKQVAEALLMTDNEETIKEMESELERLMVGLDEKVKPTLRKGSSTP